VGEALEEALLALQQVPEVLGPVPVQAAEEGEVVGPGEDIDGVHLHEAQSLDEGLKGGRGDPLPGGVEKALGPEEEALGGAARDQGDGVGHG